MSSGPISAKGYPDRFNALRCHPPHNFLAAPIIDGDGNAISSLWISGTSQRLSEKRLVKLAPVVKKVGAMASTALNPAHAKA